MHPDGPASKLADTACDFAKAVGLPLAEEVGLMLRETFAYTRLKNFVRVTEKAEALIRERGLSHRQLPEEFCLPLFEGMQRASSEELRAAFARLIAETLVEDDAVHPGLATKLGAMSSSDARVLVAVVESPPGLLTKGEEWKEKLGEAAGLSQNQAHTALLHLGSLGLLSTSRKHLGPFGLRLAEVCFADRATVERCREQYRKAGSQLLMGM